MLRSLCIVSIAFFIAGCGDGSTSKQRTAALESAEPIMSSAELERELDAVERQIQR